MADELPDVVGGLRATRDAVRRIQTMVGRLTLPPEQRKQLVENLARLTVPAESIPAIIELVESFGPPVTQIETMRRELAEQRAALEQMMGQLERTEQAVQRLATASAQLARWQEPFVRIASTVVDKVGGSDDDAEVDPEDP